MFLLFLTWLFPVTFRKCVLHRLVCFSRGCHLLLVFLCLSVCLCVKVARQQLQTKYRSIPNFFFFPFFSRPRFPSIFNSNLQYGNRFVEPFSLLDYIKEYKATLYFIHNRKVLNMATPSPNTFTDALFYFSVSPSYIIVTLSVSLSWPPKSLVSPSRHVSPLFSFLSYNFPFLIPPAFFGKCFEELQRKHTHFGREERQKERKKEKKRKTLLTWSCKPAYAKG